MSGRAVPHSSGDVHASAKIRFTAAFGDAGDAVLATEAGEVLMCVGPLAARITQVGRSFADLPAGVSSPDLHDGLAYVQESTLRTTNVRLELESGQAIAGRMFTMISEDVHRRYLVTVLTKNIGSEELGRLHRHGQVYELLFERAPTGICLVGIDGVYISANPTYCRLVGRSERELLGLTFADITHPDDRSLDASLAEDLVAKKIDRYDIEKRYVLPDGSIVWGHLTVALLFDENGEPKFYIAMLEDITERRLTQEMQALDITAERELRERLKRSVDELSLAYREKAALMTALSHDLRTPLAAIRILAELLVSNDDSISDTERGEIAQRLLSEAARTENVLGDLVASERASAGSITPQRAPVALNELIRRVVNAEFGPHSTHTVVLQLAPEDVTVMVDRALLDRMIANLLSNAVRHTKPGSKVWVSVGEGSVEEDHTVRVVVSDNGSGVPDSMKQAIFEPFVRGTADRPGSGIGLFLVRRFAEFHGGTVACTDREGGGASFCITLPHG